jgi:sigma-B regulation protein RsbU (phosphoserine phosphatase)
VTCYLLALDLILIVLRAISNALRSSYGQNLSGWIGFLGFIVICLGLVLAYRWVKARMLWRLRNRLIVTYIFIGVIPVVLLVSMGSITLYLFAGQFANFVVTNDLDSRLHSLEAANTAVANELAVRMERGDSGTNELLERLQHNALLGLEGTVCAWEEGKSAPRCNIAPQSPAPFARPAFLDENPSTPFSAIVRDRGDLYLRTAARLKAGARPVTVISSLPLDRDLLQKVAAHIGEITLYGVRRDENKQPLPPGTTFQATGEDLQVHFMAGGLPTAANFFDQQITFGTPLPVVDWASGENKPAGALLRVQTRPSLLYARLFAALGDFATGVEYALLFVGIFFAVIEIFALWIGTRLTRTVTGAVAQLYEATSRVNRGDLSHRIPVKSSDQLATLANSFNSMTASLENLLEEQRQKQRLENELTIAQEVQAQLFPRKIVQLPSLEVYGYCRPAQTVSGDYYDFLNVNSDKMILAVGDVSGKGISAALLMATIHSAVRAYSLEGIPVLRQTAAVGVLGGSEAVLTTELEGLEMSPSGMLSLLNHQLYASTPPEKYATLFLGVYDGQERRMTYSNGGHLPPIVLSEDGQVRRLDCGGTVVGLFDGMSYEEGGVSLRRGDIFLAYSDGVTEPENDFGEFGEDRLLNLVRANRHLPLERISEIVTAAVDDWIGANEQPDDVTLVLARVC